eukprot:9220331-Prorocentrum_lima.AAC.1
MSMKISTGGEARRPWRVPVVLQARNTSRIVGHGSKGTSNVGMHIQAWRTITSPTSSNKIGEFVES